MGGGGEGCAPPGAHTQVPPHQKPVHVCECAHACTCARLCVCLYGYVCFVLARVKGTILPLPPAISSHNVSPIPWASAQPLGWRLLLDSCQPQAAFCSQALSGRLLRYRSPPLARSSAQVWPARLGSDSQGLSRDNWCSHFLPARACHELSGPVTAENTDEPQNQKRPLEALGGCQSSDEHKLPFEISEPPLVSTSW